VPPTLTGFAARAGIALAPIDVSTKEYPVNQPAKFGFAIHYVTDIQAARRFYTEILGLEPERQAPTYVQFGSFAIASDESMTDQRETELYWLVDDAERALREISMQTKVTMPLKQLPFGKVFAVQDPAGNSCYLLELAANRPSKTA
jgi:predicted enzyme related to lactoylglutathione lyase